MPDAPSPHPPPSASHPPSVLPHPAPPIPSPHAFTPDHLAAIAESKRRFVPIRRELSVATFDAWSVAVFAGLTILFSPTSPPELFVGLGMGVVAGVEFHTIRRLQKLDPAAPRILAINQLGFASVLILYAACKFLFPSPGVSAELQSAIGSDPQIASLASMLNNIVRIGLPLGIVAFALIFQGGCALYHFTRIPILRRYLDSTAPWILQLHSAGLMR